MKPICWRSSQLEELQSFSNLTGESGWCVHLVLLGNSRIEELLGFPALQSLNQRIAGRCYLDKWQKAEVQQYVNFQLDALRPARKRSFKPAPSIESTKSPAVSPGLSTRFATTPSCWRPWANCRPLGRTASPRRGQTSKICRCADMGEPESLDDAVVEFGQLDDAANDGATGFAAGETDWGEADESDYLETSETDDLTTDDLETDDLAPPTSAASKPLDSSKTMSTKSSGPCPTCTTSSALRVTTSRTPLTSAVGTAASVTSEIETDTKAGDAQREHTPTEDSELEATNSAPEIGENAEESDAKECSTRYTAIRRGEIRREGSGREAGEPVDATVPPAAENPFLEQFEEEEVVFDSPTSLNRSAVPLTKQVRLRKDNRLPKFCGGWTRARCTAWRRLASLRVR